MANKMRRSRRSRRGPANDLTPYRGSIRLPNSSGLDPRTIKENLTLIYTATANGSGELRDYCSTSTVSSALDWSSFVDTYSEFRVLGIRVEFHNSYNNSYDPGRGNFAGLMASVHTPLSGPPGSAGDVGQYVNWKTLRSGAPCVHEWRARGVEEMLFSSTTAVLPNHGGLIWYCNQLNPGTDYGQYVITFLVEFRGRR